MAMQISGVTIQGGMNILPAGGSSPSPSPSPAPGASNFGYVSGGFDGSSYVNNIEKFPFSSDGNSSDVGDLTRNIGVGAGCSSATDGYTAAGDQPQSPGNGATIQKFAFASDGNASNIGNMTVWGYYVAGQSSSASGYASGGIPGTRKSTIDKFSFSSDGNGTDVGDLSIARHRASGQSSADSGYTSGGSLDSPETNYN